MSRAETSMLVRELVWEYNAHCIFRMKLITGNSRGCLVTTDANSPQKTVEYIVRLRNDSLANGIQNDFRGTTEIQLLHQSRSMMRFHSIGTEVQHVRNIFVRFSFGQ